MISSCGSSKKLTALEGEKQSIQNMLNSCTSEKSKLEADLAQSQKEAAESKRAAAEMQKKMDASDMELTNIRNLVAAEQQKIQKMKAELITAFSDYDKNAVKIDERDGRLIVVMQNKILYQSGKVALDASGMEAIQTISQVFKNNKGLNILVESHTDDVPIKTQNYKDNWDLSVARSVAVVRLLEKYGVNPTRITAAGRGEFVPVSQIAPDNSETKAKNRRTEFIITPKIQGLYKLLNEL